ncbi:hypothetical protein PG993_007063 [Apiospora rasikravindrae]|uniref:Uncharacterized protein n=1 Tax=Apiospora rasikravindrae TaxID=990691 RepID=A0ABR1SWH3_9PEZI
MSRRPQTWLFFSLSFLSAGLAVFQIPPVSKTEGFLTLALFPTLLLLAAGIVFQRAPVLRVPIIILFVSTTFALALPIDGYRRVALALSSGGYGRVAVPKDFLSVMFPSMTQFLTWALLITECREPAWQLETLATTMGGYAAGRIVLIAVSGWQMVRCDVLDQHCSDNEWWYFWTEECRTGYLSAVFALEVVVLLAWGVYKWNTDRRQRRGLADGLESEPAMGITE